MTQAPDVTKRVTVSRDEFAALAGVSVETLDRRRDQLPTPIRVGRRLLWSREEVLAFLRQKTGK